MLLLFLFFHLPSLCIGYSFLHANGTKMIDTNNREVILKGLNLGAWGLQEGYMLNPAGSSSVKTQWQMKQQYYNEGQSDAQVESFYQSWREKFITKDDIDYISSLGFNAIRLPLHYELFLTSSQRSVRNSVIHNSDNYGNYLNSLKSWCDSNQIATDQSVDAYKMIDNILNWAGSHEMFVILDMHAAPGGQGTDVAIADALYPNNLWENAWVYQDVLNRIWQQIAKRYKADGRIAFYDILNEPNNVPGGNPPIHDVLQVCNFRRDLNRDHLPSLPSLEIDYNNSK
jgi:endoglucanase